VKRKQQTFMRSARKSTIQLLRLRFIVCSADTRIRFDHGFVDMIRALPGTNGSMHLSNRCHWGSFDTPMWDFTNLIDILPPSSKQAASEWKLPQTIFVRWFDIFQDPSPIHQRPKSSLYNNLCRIHTVVISPLIHGIWITQLPILFL
jgi:hypothetical protein